MMSRRSHNTLTIELGSNTGIILSNYCKHWDKHWTPSKHLKSFLVTVNCELEFYNFLPIKEEDFDLPPNVYSDLYLLL